jgi:predicted TIM-barrel fold metal-dependent hydrolase
VSASRVIDCDVHVLVEGSEDFLDYVEPGQREWFRAQGPTFGLPGYTWAHPSSWFRADLEESPSGYPAGRVEDVLRDAVEPFGTDVAVLNADDAITVSLMGSSYRAAAFARAHNDWLREHWLVRDPRLRGSILVPAQDPLAAAEEIRRCAVDERFLQVLLVGGSERPYGDPRYLPIFEAAAESGLAVAIHSGGEGIGIAAPSGGAGPPTFYVEWHTLGSAGSIMAHLVSLVVHGIFERLPGLRVVLLEGGVAWLPGILWRLDTNWRGLRAEVPWLERRPSEVVREHIRFTTQPLEHTDGRDELLWEMLESVGAPDLLLYSSDYPHWDFDEPGHVLKRLPAEWREQVMFENAAALYGKRLGLVPA